MARRGTGCVYGPFPSSATVGTAAGLMVGTWAVPAGGGGYKRGAAYAIPSGQVDGMDVLAMYEATQRVARGIRAGEGPAFLEAITFRFRGHSMADPEFYRGKEETERWRELDPILTFRQKLESDGVIDEAAVQSLQADIEETGNEAARFAEEGPHPYPEAICGEVPKEGGGWCGGG